ncbi:FG-GAP repeat domain-containing protein [Streptomyces sp. NPDC004266]|uniref:FG-GAP repeat domain-containing protein n=1 Tax=Streptomyces sp. NPDC004266 TaxID=3364693 RepID=UPI0036C809F4
MKHTRISHRRLAAALLTLSTVTAVTGTLVTVPAVAAAPAAVAGAQATTGANLPVDAEVVSVGDTGYLTSRKNEADTTVLEWHKYEDGSVTPVGTGIVGYESNSDLLVTGDGNTISVRDMKNGGAWRASFNIGAEFPSGSTKLVGVVNENLFVSVSTTEDYHELWQLSKVNGVTKKSKLSSRPKNIDYKVVASRGNDFVVLGSVREPYIPTDRIVYWTATSNVNNGSVVDWGGSSGTSQWDQSSTGALTADWKGWVHATQEGGLEFSAQRTGTTTVARVPLTGELTRAVVAGIVGDTVLYGVPGTATAEAPSPLYARSLTDAGAQPYRVLDNFSSAAHAPDGSLLVRGFDANGDGLFRITGSGGARPTVTLESDTGRVMAVQFADAQVPTYADLEKTGTTVPMEWTLSRGNATVDLTLTHVTTGRKLTKRLAPSVSGNRFTYVWDGVLDGISAPNGAYTWKATATPTDGVGGPATVSGTLQVQRRANAHDFDDNGSTDVLARDAAGVLWRDDLFDGPVNGQIKSARRTKLGAGFQAYNAIEAAGNLAGGPAGDFVARDTAGVLWSFLGKGDGTFVNRTRVGAGWGAYNKIAAGSDLTGDGRPDLVAVDTSGALWLHKATGNWAAPYAPRVKLAAGGFNSYNQITAVGNTAGGAAGDLVARDTAGVLWLFLGKGDGTFAPRTRIGAGWGAFSQLAWAGDLDNDGRGDLIGYGSGGTWAYVGTGSTTAPFTRVATSLYAGEGTKFNAVS